MNKVILSALLLMAVVAPFVELRPNHSDPVKLAEKSSVGNDSGIKSQATAQNGAGQRAQTPREGTGKDCCAFRWRVAEEKK